MARGRSVDYFAEPIDVTEEYERLASKRWAFWLMILAITVGWMAYSYWFNRAAFLLGGWFVPTLVFPMAVIPAYFADRRFFKAPRVVKRGARVLRVFLLGGSCLLRMDTTDERDPRVIDSPAVRLDDPQTDVTVFHYGIYINGGKKSNHNMIELRNKAFANDGARLDFIEAMKGMGAEVRFYDDASDRSLATIAGPMSRPHEVTRECRDSLRIGWVAIVVASTLVILIWFALSGFNWSSSDWIWKPLVGALPLIVYPFLVRKFTRALRRGRLFVGYVCDESRVGRAHFADVGAGLVPVFGKTLPMSEIRSVKVCPMEVVLQGSGRKKVRLPTQDFASQEAYESFVGKIERSGRQLEFTDMFGNRVDELPPRWTGEPLPRSE